MDRLLIILKKENGPRASSAPALGLNTIIFKYVYWYMKRISGERLQDHWSSGLCLYSWVCVEPFRKPHYCWFPHFMAIMTVDKNPDSVAQFTSTNQDLIEGKRFLFMIYGMTL